jgi:MFS family permease
MAGKNEVGSQVSEACGTGWFGLSRNVLVLGLVSLFNDLSSEMAYPLLPLFLTETLGAGALFLGLVEGLADFIASLLQVFSGWISDHTRKRKGLAVGGYSLSGAARGYLALATGPWQVLVAWFFNRVGKGLRSAPRDALIADSCSPRERGRSFGYHRAMDHMGALFGAAMASILLAAVTTDYRTVFAIAFIPAVLGVFLLAALVKEPKPPAIPAKTAGEAGAGSAAAPRRLSLSLKPFDRRFRLFLLATLVFTLGNSSDAFLLLRARQQGGMSVALIPALWGVLHVVKVVANLRGGELSDRVGRRGIIIAGWGVYALAYLGFAVVSGPAWFWGLFVLYGLYFMYEGAGKALVTDLVPEELRGTAFGLYNFIISVTLLPASLIMGLLWKEQGANYAFVFGAAMSVAAIVILLFIPGKEKG